jgi:HPr kinase/phosphorylase
MLPHLIAGGRARGVKPVLLHATAVMINGHGVALCGKSGSGKSDLALRLIDRGAMLIGDDYVEIRESDDGLICQCKPNIAGMLEIRDVGIITLPYAPSAPLHFVVELDQPTDRLPAEGETMRIGDYAVPSVRLNALHASAPQKVERALHMAIDAGRVTLRI